MSTTPRDELAELTRLFAAQFEWQRESGATGLEGSFAVPPVSKSATESTVPSSRGPARESAPASAPVAASSTAPSPAPDSPAAQPGPPVKFQMPTFLRKGGVGPRPPMGELVPPPSTASEPRANVSVEAKAVGQVPLPSGPRQLASSDEDESGAPEVNAAPVPDSVQIAAATPVVAKATFESTPPLLGKARLDALAVLSDQVRDCTKCRLHEGRTQTVFARGNPMAPIAFVGEGPGRDEDLQGYPFVGAAGQLLDKIIAAMGFGPDDVYICNVVKCRPPNNRTPAPDEMAACGPYLVSQLGAVRPQIVVALGKTAASFLLDTNEPMTRLRGQWHTWQGIPLLATWHPAYLLRQPEAKRDTWDDMKLVLRRLGRSVPQRS